MNRIETNKEPLLDTEAAARLLNISRRTLEAWVRQRRVPYVKFGTAKNSPTRFQPAALRDWIEAQQIMPAAPASKASPGQQAENLRALFSQWEDDDAARVAALTPEQRAAEDAQWDAIQRNIERSHIALRVPDVTAGE